MKLPLPLAVTSLESKLVTGLPSPQLMVPEKSLVGAFALASVKVAVRLVGVVYSTPPLA